MLCLNWQHQKLHPDHDACVLISSGINAAG
jgi:hypothetical protein